MQPFTIVEGVAAPFLEDDVNTDQIAPIGVGARMDPDYAEMAFGRRRKKPDGSIEPDFFLNKARFSKPTILVAGANFGCGSSREGAVWCMQAIGVRAIVARSFADIYRENCLQNGVLPAVLAAGDAEKFEALVVKTDGAGNFKIDLAAGTITGPGGETFRFDLPPAERTRLLEGLDDIGLSLKHDAEIAAFEARRKQSHPWSQRADANAL
jgi:3-isopropylmalate dehydratase small subunit